MDWHLYPVVCLCVCVCAHSRMFPSCMSVCKCTSNVQVHLLRVSVVYCTCVHIHIRSVFNIFALYGNYDVIFSTQVSLCVLSTSVSSCRDCMNMINVTTLLPVN